MRLVPAHIGASKKRREVQEEEMSEAEREAGKGLTFLRLSESGTSTLHVSSPRAPSPCFLRLRSITPQSSVVAASRPA